MEIITTNENGDKMVIAMDIDENDNDVNDGYDEDYYDVGRVVPGIF